MSRKPLAYKKLVLYNHDYSQIPQADFLSLQINFYTLWKFQNFYSILF